MSSRLIANLTSGKKQTIVAYGTSLTAGGQWVNDLQSWLDHSHSGLARVINSGQSGKASKTALALLDSSVLAHQPDVVFIEFAVNDATSYEADNFDHGISLAQSEANLNQLIDRILAHNFSAEIIIQTMNPAWDAPNGNRSASRRPHLSGYYDVYRKVARERSLLLIDHHRNWSQLEKTNRTQYECYLPDGVHPTAEGSSAITTPEIKRALAT